MKSVLYLSEQVIEFSESEISEIANYSRKKNHGRGIYGYLNFSNGQFVQYLEGEDEAVSLLLDTIKQDPRHQFVYGIETHQFEQRLFPSWDMRLLSSDEADQINLERYVTQNLLLLKDGAVNKERCEELLWKYVVRISKMRTLSMNSTNILY